MKFNDKHVLVPYDKYKKLLEGASSTNSNAKISLESSTPDVVHHEFTVKDKDKADEEDLWQHIPLQRRKAGKALLELLQPLNGLKEKDVIQYTQTNLLPPEGFRHIVARLVEAEVPLSLILNKSLKELLLTLRYLETDSEEDEERETETPPVIKQSEESLAEKKPGRKVKWITL